jgi:hypothetical protein
MTKEQLEEINRFISFLQGKVSNASSAKTREQAYRTLDSLYTLRREWEELSTRLSTNE